MDKMKEADCIKPLISPFAAPIVCVQKGKSNIRVTFYFQMINKNFVNDAYTLHRIDTQIDSLRGSAWLTTLDLTNNYHQMNLDIGSHEYIALQRLWDCINGNFCLW